jgi:hypothetical protein
MTSYNVISRKIFCYDTNLAHQYITRYFFIIYNEKQYLSKQNLLGNVRNGKFFANYLNYGTGKIQTQNLAITIHTLLFSKSESLMSDKE